MLSKLAIGLAAAAIAMGGSTLSASAMHGGGGGGGGPHGGNVSGFGPHGGGGRYAMRGYGREHWRGHYGGYRYYRPYRYSYGGSCWRWTPEGRVWVCGRGYGYGPSYGPSYGYYRGWGYRHGGRGPGPHGGGGRFR